MRSPSKNASTNSFPTQKNPAADTCALEREIKAHGYADYRNFQSVIESARTACFNSGQRVDDHFVEVADMIGVGKGEAPGHVPTGQISVSVFD